MGERTREEILEARRLILAHSRERARIAGEFQGQYGKWLIASLLLVHGAAFGFLATSEEMSRAYLPHVFWWPVAGLVLALACGFLTWVNWGLHLNAELCVDAGTLHDLDRDWPDVDRRIVRWVKPTFRLAVLSGAGSALCILGGAITAFLRMPAAT
ncbi:MAG: hypothetical protein DCC69_14380 [Hyphomicrobiales bacterium]|nr:MAG: hypothetical protein DCC69_14380 [Hyphomicrobiales bacterium]